MAVQSGRGQQAPIDVHASAASPAFVGRDEDLAALLQALRDPPALVLIEGEPGIGKTRLLHEALAAATGRTVLLAPCPALREPFPLGPVVDSVRRLRPKLGEIGLSPLGGALRPLFPEWVDQLPPALEPLDDPKETKHRIFAALTELIDRLGVEVLVVEDAHWADSATLELLLTLVTTPDRRLSLVVTYRPTDVPDESLLLRLTSHPPVGMAQVRLELGPLAIDDTRQLVGSMFGTDQVSERFATFLHERTDGVPLAVEETVRLLRDRHDIVRHDGRWTRRLLDELEVPATVRDSVLERMARLKPEARQVLEAAVVLASPAEEVLLTTVAGLTKRAGSSAVAATLASGLLREADPGQFVFRHALDAQAIADAIPASRRRSLHGRAAEALRAVKPEPVVRLARHFREASDTEAWCRYAEASADLALESGDDESVIATLLDVLGSVDHPIERRVRLARKVGEAIHVGAAPTAAFAGQVAESLSAVLDSGEIGRGERGELRLLLGRVLWRTGQQRAAFEEIEAAVPDLDRRPDLAIRAMFNLARPFSSPDWPVERHLHWVDRATQLANTAGSVADRKYVARARSNLLLMLGQPEAWESVEVLPPTRASGLPERRLAAGQLLNTAMATLPWGRYDITRRWLDDGLALAEAMDYKRFLNAARVFVAYLDWYTGAWDGLASTVSALAESDETEPFSVQAFARQLHSVLNIVTGNRTAGEPSLRRQAEEAGHRLVAEPEAKLAPSMLARLLVDDGATEEALQVTAPVVEMIARKGVWLWATDIAPGHVDALILSRHTDEATNFVSDFATGIEGRDAPAPSASLMLCRAILAHASDPVEGAASFAGAATAWAALPRPYDELLALERQGLSLLVAGERDDGLAVLTDAQRRLTELGAKWDADRVAHLLRQHGVEVSRAWKRGPRGYGGQLSPREQEVLALVARGMTNREIGQVLFLSPRTVGVHMGAVMRKLGVSSRTAAAMAAADAGLISADGDSVVGDSAAN